MPEPLSWGLPNNNSHLCPIVIFVLFNPNFTPCWGRLPVEQYLIRHWDHSSTEPIDRQRLRLIQFGEAWYEPDPNDANPAFAPKRIPTDHEVKVILSPWGSHDLRKRAWEIWCGKDWGYPVMLRTYCGNVEEGDRKFAEYTQVSEIYRVVADCLVLSDAEIFNFGSDWRRIFEILPEIASCKGHQPDYDASDITNYDDYADLENEIRDSKAKYPDWKEDPDISLEPGNTVIRLSLQTTAISTDELLIISLDVYQDVTIWGRLGLDQGYIDEMFMRWEDGGRPLGLVMENGTVGERYRLSKSREGGFFV
ncbi:hypothetical protein BDV09DRAFT_189070 [Aspergillus tetrazonus]